MKNIDLFKQLKREKKLTKALVYPGIRVEQDPDYKNFETTELNPIPVDVYFSEISMESLKWKYVSQVPAQSAKILCKKSFENLFKEAVRIKIKDRDYQTYRDSGIGFLIREVDNSYIEVILSLKLR